MQLPFYKYQGTGNDFILIDNRDLKFGNLDVKFLCNPKFGIGADGLMLVQNKEGYDFEMVYYNSDGNVSTMCGNGGRCIVHFAKFLDVFKGNTTLFWAIDGEHEALIDGDYVELKMINVDTVENIDKDFSLNTGSPHYIVFDNNISDINLIEAATKIRYNDVYSKEGINVNFIEQLDNETIKVRTYERGVENETYSCGTGVTAAAIAYKIHANLKSSHYSINIETIGGDLKVKFKGETDFHDIWLCGPAVQVFLGIINI